MSNMKSILGDMTLEEFEVKRKSVLEKLKDINIYDFIEITYGDTNDLYNIWLELEGKEFAMKRMEAYNNKVKIDQIGDFTQGILDEFMDWLESFD